MMCTISYIILYEIMILLFLQGWQKFGKNNTQGIIIVNSKASGMVKATYYNNITLRQKKFLLWNTYP